MRKLLVVAVILVVAAAGLAAAERKLELSFEPVQELLQAKCASCHEWASTADGIAGLVKPGDLAASPIWQKVSRNLMPPDEPLADVDKETLREWIAAGAPTADAITGATAAEAAPGEIAPADTTAAATSAESGAAPAEAGAASADATTSATAAGSSASGGFLGFKSRTAFHMASGYTSSALFLGAGIVGAVQWGTLIYESHNYRDEHIPPIEEDQISAECAGFIADLRDDPLHSALRWTHVGLMSVAEALYLANAVTGIGMLTKDRPGLTPQDIHRYAFFTHGALMIGELVLGILSSTFLDWGDHWSIIGVGIAHSAIGITIPLVMLGAGIYVDAVFR